MPLRRCQESELTAPGWRLPEASLCITRRGMERNACGRAARGDRPQCLYSAARRASSLRPVGAYPKPRCASPGAGRSATPAVGRREEIGLSDHPPAWLRCVTFWYRAGPKCHTPRWLKLRVGLARSCPPLRRRNASGWPFARTLVGHRPAGDGSATGPVGPCPGPRCAPPCGRRERNAPGRPIHFSANQELKAGSSDWHPAAGGSCIA